MKLVMILATEVLAHSFLGSVLLLLLMLPLIKGRQLDETDTEAPAPNNMDGVPPSIQG